MSFDMKKKKFPKKSVEDLACFSGSQLFTEPKSTSSLYQPSFEQFLNYSEQFFEKRHYTNNGPLVKLLEQRLADFHDAKYCIAFCSGFWALVLAMNSLALEGRTEIIMPSLTYRRMADIAAWANLTPRFCEVVPNTLGVSAADIRACINSETALIMAVHPIVNACDIDGIERLGAEFGIPVLFDAVESMYESVMSGKVGKFGDAECFSMHASKLLNGFEGGYITTNNHELAGRLSLLRTFGFKGQDNCVLPGGLNARLNELHAAMALANLDEMDILVSENKLRYRCYQDGLSSVKGLKLLEFDERFQTSYKNIVIELLLDDWPLSRNDTIKVLNAENILARAHYAPPLHQKKMSYPHIPAHLPLTDKLSERYINLPCGDFVSDEDIETIITMLEFIRSNSEEIKDCLQA